MISRVSTLHKYLPVYPPHPSFGIVLRSRNPSTLTPALLLSVVPWLNYGMNQINACCAECGKEGGISLKVCKSCMLVKYCNAECQKNHWPKHKKECKQRAAELRDEALFKDPPAKEDCPICFLPMPLNLVCCMSLPDATIESVPIYDFAEQNRKMSIMDTETYYSCCGKTICKGCVYSSRKSGNHDKCPFCKTDRASKTDEVVVEEIMMMPMRFMC
jgi:hypothetical protein